MDISHTDAYRAQRDRKYSPLAHELGHILMNAGHVSYRNLMAGSVSRVDGSLTSAQCYALSVSPLISTLH